MKLKKQKTKKCVIKRKLKLCQNYKNCLEAAQIENKISHLAKNKIDVYSPKESLKNNKILLNPKQILKLEVIMFPLKKLTKLL